MNKKILYLTVAVVIILLGASTVSAIVTPPPGIKDTNLKTIWAAIMDLQKQINKLTAQQPVTISGKTTWDNGIAIPAGFPDKCNIVTGINEASCPPEYPIMIEVGSSYSLGATKLSIGSFAKCSNSDGEKHIEYGWANYLITCHS